MKIFRNKFLVKLIASLCVFLTISSCTLTKKVYAEDEVYGGGLLSPIMNLFTGIADGIMDILHNTVLEQEETLIKIDGTADSWWSQHGASVVGWLVGIAVAVLIVATAILSGGLSIGAGMGILANISGVCFVIKGLALAALGGTASGVIVGRVIEGAQMADDLYLPVYNLSISEIFANKIPLFDVNFFNPNNYFEDVPFEKTVSNDWLLRETSKEYRNVKMNEAFLGDGLAEKLCNYYYTDLHPAERLCGNHGTCELGWY